MLAVSLPLAVDAGGLRRSATCSPEPDNTDHGSKPVAPRLLLLVQERPRERVPYSILISKQVAATVDFKKSE
jgi:hypothetical protein